MTFTSLYQASNAMGISNNALRNACEHNNKAYNQAKGRVRKYELDWHDICCVCKAIDNVKGEVRGCVFPAWKFGEDGHIVFL